MGSNEAPHTENFTAQVCFGSYPSVLPKTNHGVSDFSINTLIVVMALVSNVFTA